MLTYEDIPVELNLADWFLDARVREGRGGRTALTCGDDASYSYAEVAAAANRMGHVLREAGVRREERVLIALGDGLEFVAAWYGALKIGAVVAEVYTFLKPSDYAYYLRYTRATAVLVDGAALTAMREAVAAADEAPALLVAGGGELGAGELDLDALLAAAPAELEPAATTRDDIAIWKFTTGSTGAPKAAVHLVHDPVIASACYGQGVLGLTEDDAVLPVPKLFFGYARDATTLFTFEAGAAGIVFPERSTPERLFALIARHRPTVLVQVPSMMRAMLAHPAAPEQDLSCVRCCISSGEALPAELYRRWLDAFGVEVLDGVGSSEAYHIYLSGRRGAVRPGRVGQVVPGYEASLLDTGGRPVPDGEAGELWIRGESAAVMYWGDHERSKRTFAGDAVRTGDLFARDADGYYAYRGRADDLLKVRGIWVAPAEIEDCLLEHPEVEDCAVVGVEDVDGLVTPTAFVVAPGAAVTADELQAFVRTQLSPHKYPRDVRFLDRLPRTASGKVDRSELRTVTMNGRT